MLSDEKGKEEQRASEAMEDRQGEDSKEDQKDEGPQWDKDEDLCLRQLVPTQGPIDWTTIAAKHGQSFPQRPRSAADCKERWYGHLDAALGRPSWTEQDDLEMLLAHRKYQNRWSDVAAALNGRSGNTIKNKFYSVFRKVKNKVKKGETTYSSRVELLEIQYIIALMYHYFAHPIPLSEAKYKRGKDFIYTLLQGVCLEDVQRYQAEFARQWPDATPLDELWEELAAPLKQKLSVLFTPSPSPADIRLEPILGVPFHNGKYLLPEPKAVPHPGTVTPEEKDFIITQTFHRMGPCSAGSRVYQPMVMSPPASTLPPFSAGRPVPSLFSSPQVRYGNFSDFSEVATRSSAKAYPGSGAPGPGQHALAHPPQSYSLFSPGRQGTAPFPTQSYSLFAQPPAPSYYPAPSTQLRSMGPPFP